MQPFGGELIEGVLERLGIGEEQCALAEIVEQKAREHDGEPSGADRDAAEMAHVGIERLAARDGQEHAP